MKINKYLRMIYVFAILGLQMLGNVASMIPILEEELVIKRKLVTKEEILDAIAIGRCGPGAAVINTIVLIGNNIEGFMGGVIAAMSFIIFPCVIIIFISLIIDKVLDNQVVVSAFKAVTVSISLMITNTIGDLAKRTLTNKTIIIVFFIVLLVIIFTPISPIICIISVIFLGILFNLKAQ